MIVDADKNHDGHVTWSEFLSMMRTHNSVTTNTAEAEVIDENVEALQAFKMFDVNDDGFIDQKELVNVMRVSIISTLT